MAYVVLTLAAVGLAIYGLVDCWNSSDEEIRVLPKPLWMTLLLVPLAGGLLWITFGKAPGGWSGPPGRRALAPDDDPEFLRSLGTGSAPLPPERGQDRDRTGQGEGKGAAADPRPTDPDPSQGSSSDSGPTPRNGGDTGDPGPRLP
ncbi:MAG: hypothetical protein QG608_3726 [Actinomycetota bacterium]|nr:hypothetical protein [Actinomycetota bacterium]